MQLKWFIGIICFLIIGATIYLLVTNKHKEPVIVSINQEYEQYPLKAEGKIPHWLQGTFVRNGPISVQIGDQKLAHWFDGPAMLHAFAFQEGNVLYSNKFLRTSVYDSIFIDGNLNYGGFASSAGFFKTTWGKVKRWVSLDSKPKIQNANVNVTKIANQHVALTETPLPVIFDLEQLNTLGALMYEDDLPKANTFESAHPLYDEKVDEKINYLVEYGKDSFYVIYKFNPNKPEREVIGKIPVKKPSYMHSFAITQNYIVLVEFPFTVNPLDLAIMRKPFIKNFEWHPEQGTHFLIIDRKTGKLLKDLKYDHSFFAFHHVNAYEDKDNIILDIVTYPNADIIANVAVYENANEPLNQNLAQSSSNQSRLVRFKVSMKQDTIQALELLSSKVEFPRINEKQIAYPHRYVYAVDPSPILQEQDLRPLYKIDTLKNEKVVWQVPGLQAGEPVFIAKPGSAEEDDGVVLTIVLEANRQKAFLLILDGKTFKEIARLYTPHPIPVGLHAQFF